MQHSRDQARTRLVSYLEERGMLDEAAAARLRRLASSSDQPLPILISQFALMPEPALAEALGACFGVPVVTAAGFPAAPILSDQITEPFLRQHHAVPISGSADRLRVAVVDPSDPYPAEALGLMVGRSVDVAVAAPADINQALDRLYGRRAVSAESSPAAAQVSKPGLGDAERLHDLASDAPVVKLAAALVGDAVEAGASDIHIEPFADRVLARIRIDGVLREVARYAPELQAPLVSRIKIMAGLDIAERRLPQDGRSQVTARGRAIDIRVSAVPTLFGESVVMRLLDRDRAPLSFDRLGFDPALLSLLLGLLDRPHGILLVTGPTGSGKTTTLYAALNRLNAPERKILTAEDPIEYQLPGINQIQVAPKIGLDFAHILRSVLRQDPDILMVGEVRDPETARMAVQAALTGHLVLSTVHTNSAAATIARLIDMGVEPYLLAASLVGILGQRLVRTLCPACAEPDPRPISAFGLPDLTHAAALAMHPALRRARGCAACGNTGYRGRTVMAELLPVTEAMAALIAEGAPTAAIEAAARRGGMRTLSEDGCRKVLAGSTTVSEVLRASSLG